MNSTLTSHKPARIGKYLGISLMAVGAFFLFDPFISVVDLLPDALGYLFFLLGLYRLSDLDERIMEASKGLRYLALVGVARIIALLLAFGFVSPTEQPVFMLLALFTLGVLDCIILIPLWKNLCGGLIYLGSRNDATVMFDRRRPGGRMSTRNLLERYTAYSTVYFVLREVLAVLPELTVLSHEKGGVELDEATQFYDFVGMYRLVGGAVSLILGIIWLVWTLRVLSRLKSDTPFFRRLTEKYSAEVLTRHDLFAMRSVKLSLGCLTVAAVLSLDLYLDGINILPDTLSAVFLLLSVIFISRYVGKNLPALVASAAYGLTAGLSWFLQVKGFCRVTDLTEIARDPGLEENWRVSLLLQAVTAALLVASTVLILRILYGLVKRYTGVQAFREGLPAGTGYAAERTGAIHGVIRKKLTAVGVLGGLVALSTLFWWGMIPMLPEMELTLSGAGAQTQNTVATLITTAYQILTEGYWFVDLAVGGVWIGTIISAAGEISEQMEYSAMMRE